MSTFHTLTFLEAAVALGMAKRMQELGFEVLWDVRNPEQVEYTQMANMPGPGVLKYDVKPVEDWFKHPQIDTRFFYFEAQNGSIFQQEPRVPSNFYRYRLRRSYLAKVQIEVGKSTLALSGLQYDKSFYEWLAKHDGV